MPDGPLRAVPYRHQDRLDTGGHTEFPLGILDVKIDGLAGDPEDLADFPIRLPAGDPTEDFGLAQCQRLMCGVGDQGNLPGNLGWQCGRLAMMDIAWWLAHPNLVAFPRPDDENARIVQCMHVKREIIVNGLR